MKYIIQFILQFPTYYVLVNGLAALTGLSDWWCVPICVAIVISYDIGEMIKRED